MHRMLKKAVIKYRFLGLRGRKNGVWSGNFQTEDGFELNRGCLTRKEHNEYAVECAASTKGARVEAMNDTTNCSPNELPVTGGNSRQIFVWKVLVIINKGNNIAKRSNGFFY